MGFTSTEVLYRITNSIAKTEMWKSCCYRHRWTVTSFLVAPRYLQKSPLIWHWNDWISQSDCWGLPNSPELLALSLRHQVLTSSTLKACCISLMIEPLCLCPENNAAHPSLPGSTQFLGALGPISESWSLTFPFFMTVQILKWAHALQKHVDAFPLHPPSTLRLQQLWRDLWKSSGPGSAQSRSNHNSCFLFFQGAWLKY